MTEVSSSIHRLRVPFRAGVKTSLVCTCLLCFIATGRQTFGQTPIAQPSESSALDTGASSVVAPGTPGALTIDQVVALALSNNSSVVAASLRLEKANQAIKQTDASGYPQVRIDVAAAYTSTKQFGANAGGAGATGVTLPGGGAIPVVVDQGGSTNGTFVAGNSTGSGSIFSPTVTTGGAGASNNGGGVSTTTSTGAAPVTGGTNGTGASSHALPAPLAALATASQSPTRVASSVANPQATAPPTNNFFVGGQNLNYGARFSISQGIDLFRLVPTALGVERETRDFYVTDLQRTANELALSVKTQFYSVLRAQALLTSNQEQVSAASDSLRIANLRFQAGVAPHFDVVTAQTTLSNAQQQFSTAQDQLDLSRANLNNLLGRDLDQPVALIDPAVDPDTLSPDLKASVATAQLNRPEIIQATSNIAIAKKLVTLARANLLPSLSLNADASYSGLVRSGSSNPTYSLTANFGFPLYDGGATKARTRSAEIDVQSQQLTLDQLKQNVRLEVRSAYLNILDAKARAKSSLQGVTQARESVRLANLRYQNQQGTFLEVTNAEAQLATAENNYATARFDLGTSLAQLQRATGGR